jgi:hypothetical protein
MYDTVGHAHGPVPRTLAGIIQDAPFRAAMLRRQPSMGVLILRHRPGWAAPGKVRQASPPGA